MCLAIPGKIKKLKGELATVDFDGLQKEINVSLVDAKNGDWVVVHAGFAIQKLEEKEAEEIKVLFKKQ